MDSHTRRTNNSAPGVPSSPDGSRFASRSRAGLPAAARTAQSIRICEKCGLPFPLNVYGMRNDLGLCRECRERYVRTCRVCRKLYRTDENSPTGDLCRTCYYLVYADDEEND